MDIVGAGICVRCGRRQRLIPLQPGERLLTSAEICECEGAEHWQLRVLRCRTNLLRECSCGGVRPDATARGVAAPVVELRTHYPPGSRIAVIRFRPEFQ